MRSISEPTKAITAASAGTPNAARAAMRSAAEGGRKRRASKPWGMIVSRSGGIPACRDDGRKAGDIAT